MQKITVYSAIDRQYYEGIILEEVALSDQASMLTVGIDDLEISIIKYGDNCIFTTDDWQSSQPDKKEDIGDYRWLDSNGVQAVLIDGLPRTIVS